MSSQPKILAAAILLSLAPLAGAQVATGTTGTTITPPPTTTSASVPANRLAGLFAGFFGSRENALAAVNALRTGSAITIVTTPPCPAPCTTPPTGTETTIDNATRPMGWGNVRHTLALAQYSLAQAGITKPTPEQIAAALNGGTVTTDAGKTVELNGILTMRAGGMGWGQIAKAEGTSMGRVNQSIKPFKADTTPTTTTSTTTAAAPPAPKHLGITTGAGVSSGVVTAGGGHGTGHASKHAQSGRGIVTGTGGSVGAGVSTGGGHGGGHGNGHAHGQGHAAGTGVTTAANTAASTTITTAHGGGNGHGMATARNGNGNGKGGGK